MTGLHSPHESAFSRRTTDMNYVVVFDTRETLALRTHAFLDAATHCSVVLDK